MSGPIDTFGESASDFGVSAIEVREGREAHIGSARILRVLPTKRRRTVGPWCFVDLMAPVDVTHPPPLEIGPHPHIGLATVTWLFGGEVLHSDSLGTQQLIRPGQLNLMTSGHGIAHAEEGIAAHVPDDTGGIAGVQMWLAQPDATRNGSSRFQHLPDLPVVDAGPVRARILVGSFGPETSPAVIDHPTIGLDVSITGPATIALEPTFEHAVVPVDRPLLVEDAVVEPGSLALVPAGLPAIAVRSRSGPGRFMLLGGAPLGTQLKMWWNFVARTADEITAAWRAWQEHDEDRYAPVPSALPRIDAPPPPWVRTT